VAYVSSSAAGDGNAPATATLTAAQAWVIAAHDVGSSASLVNVLWSKLDASTGWTGLRIAGLDGLQRARLTALPTYTQGVRPAFEVVYLDTSRAWPAAYNEYVDAQTGAVLTRQNAVQSLSDAPLAVATAPHTATAATTATCDPTGSACALSGTLPVTTSVSCAAP